ncbi:DinB family protein [Paenibacillus sambharensis]|uniref:DinB family protein n=1 Tax=Paenibacillus sambharensis TaxID=1803190 RepID=A0A2W1L9Y9_9BACL|nr:DinB family protein [Paenibacillus sambharensis]PZD96056.1 DinB family protein [Paenibacillus sambharensis]
MTGRGQLLADFREWIEYVKELERLSLEAWSRPVGPGKWSVKEVVSHIMLWDKTFCEEAIERIYRDEPLTVRHLDYDRFNADASRYGLAASIQHLSDQSIRYRERIIDLIQSLSEESYSRTYLDGDRQMFKVEQYLHDFIAHDRHHMKQIRSVLAADKSLLNRGSEPDGLAVM